MLERPLQSRRAAALFFGAAVLVVGSAHAAGLTSADTNQDGRISRAEANAAQDRAFKRLDTNHDGQIDAKEFDAGQPGLPADATAQDKKRRHRVIDGWFHHMDSDGNGKISRSEYRKALTPYFNSLDANGDGYISADELKKAFGGPKPGSQQN